MRKSEMDGSVSNDAMDARVSEWLAVREEEALKETNMLSGCESDLYVRGKSADVTAFRAAVKTEYGEFDFTVAIPYPAKIAAIVAGEYAVWNCCGSKDVFLAALDAHRVKWRIGAFESVVDWRLKNWVSLANAYQVSIEDVESAEVEGEEANCVHFQSAGSSPLPVIAALARRFPALELRFDYFNSSFAYCGSTVWCGDEKLKETVDFNYYRDGGW